MDGMFVSGIYGYLANELSWNKARKNMIFIFFRKNRL